MIIAYNKQIGCEPVENRGSEVEVRHGVSVAKHRSELTALKVVFGNESIRVGSTVYVPSMSKNLPWFSQVHKIGSQAFILVPETSVLLVDTTALEKFAKWEATAAELDDLKTPILIRNARSFIVHSPDGVREFEHYVDARDYVKKLGLKDSGPSEFGALK
jgi:hypothetical protein